MAGSRSERNRLVGMLLLLWSALGAGLSWGKDARGTQVPWIGASFQLGARTHTGGGSTLFPGVAVSIQQAKFDELRAAVEEIYNAKGLIDMKKVLRVAGQLAWDRKLILRYCC